MLTSLTSAVSGLENFQEEMDVIGNNIANVDTTGYKAARTDFADAFSNTLAASGGNSDAGSGSSSVQIGTGVSVVGITSNMTQGALNSTGIPSDLAISGNGYFMVRDTVTNAQYATRAGDFQVDSSGFLITDSGERVQGLSDAGLSTFGDIQINTTGMPATSSPTASVSSYTINGQGQVTVNLSDGTSFVRGQVLMQNFTNPQALTKAGGNLYTGLAAAGPLVGIAAAGTNGLGTIKSGALELSNVDLSNEMANLITAQRAFEANSKIITSSDQMLQTLTHMTQ